MDNVKIEIEPLRILSRDLELRDLLQPLADDHKKIVPAMLIGASVLFLIAGLTIAVTGVIGILEPHGADSASVVILGAAFMMSFAGAHLLDRTE